MLNVIIVCHITILDFSGLVNNFKDIVHVGYWFANTGFIVALWIVHWTLNHTSGLGIGSSLVLNSCRSPTNQGREPSISQKYFSFFL